MRCVMIQILVLGLLAAAAPADAAADAEGDTVYTLVEKGRQLFRAGKYKEAQEKFAEAEVKAPENRLVAYNRACAYHGAGDLDKAEEYYRKVDVSTDVDLSTRTAFNLGTLQVHRARALLGKDPLQVPVETRKDILDCMENAVARFRTVLEARPGDRDARYNIEVVRLWVKDMLDRWRKADREKARKESDLLRYLETLMLAQDGLREETEALEKGEDASGKPVRLEQVIMVQEELVEEMPHLRAKVKEHLEKMAKPPANPRTPPPAQQDPKMEEKLKKAGEALGTLVDQAEESMGKAVGALNDVKLVDAASSQTSAHDSLFQMWKGLADFGAVLARAIRDEEEVIAGTGPFAGLESGEKEELEEAEAEEASERLKEDQEKVRDLVPLLSARAGMAVKQLEKTANNTGGAPPQPGGQPSPQETKKALEKALLLLPKADEAMEGAVEALGGRRWKEGLEQEKEAEKILKEIQKLFKNKQQKQNDKKNQDGKKKQDKKKDEQQKKNEKNEKNKKKDPKKMDREQAKRQLQKMRESRKKREKKRHAAEMARRPRVEKDW